ncbi:MAG: FtsX-like permease family protein [Pseudoxanthomonas sp.]
MSIRILFSVLRRHSLMPALVLLQVALACAILCNVLFLLWQRLEPMVAPSGVADNELILVDQLFSMQHPWSKSDVETGTAMLRQVPGVKAVSAANGLPMVSTTLYVLKLKGSSGAILDVNAYTGRGLVDTLGVTLVAGRDFLPGEYVDTGIGADAIVDSKSSGAQAIIITQALADRLFPDGAALGNVLSEPSDKDSHGYVVVGIARHLLRNQLGIATNGRADYTVLLAQSVGKTSILSFAVRVDPASREFALRKVREVIHRQFEPAMADGSHATVSFYNERRDAAFADAHAALDLFAGVVLCVVVVTMVGIMGLTGFWVQKRTRQIGIRRALGARRKHIVRYFLAENLLIVSMGVVLGMLLAYGGNLLLMHYYELSRLPWSYLPLGALVMLLLGQLAVLGPALRAAAVPPVVATRAT